MSAEQENDVICPGVCMWGGEHENQHRCIGGRQGGICRRFLLKASLSTLKSHEWPGVIVRRGGGWGDWHGAHFPKMLVFIIINSKLLFL